MNPVRLAIDVTGGDHGCSVVVKGVVDALRRSPGSFTAILCGDKTQVRDALAAQGVEPDVAGLSIEHCAQSVTTQDPPSTVWKRKCGSSVVRCIRLQAEGAADASISAGITGVLMASAVFILGLQDGVSRPALAAFIPTAGRRPVLLLDVGANLDCRAKHLLSFGVMGHDYARLYHGDDSIKVSLLNVGVEPQKGTRVILEAAQLLTQHCSGYQGYIEGSRILAGETDVVVCDGFVGNVLLKSFESFFGLTRAVLSGDKELLTRIESRMSILNSEMYGAVPLVGVNGIVFKAHGNASPGAISNAIGSAVTTLNQRAILAQQFGVSKGISRKYAV